jgi:chloramphenicol-sensitive protein RarD
MLLLLSSALLIAANWVIYIWAVSSNHLMAASLGYFLNPLVNVGLGVLVLGERLRQAQKIAIGIAAIGVAIAASTAVTDLWISLSLAVSFAIYGLIRKSAPVSAVDGLTMETVLLSPVCLGLLFWWSRTSPLSFGQSWHLDVLLMFSAVATSLPLTMFARAAQLLPYATLGLIQYISPLIVFLLANFVYHEPMHPLMLVAFGFIWVALMVFTVDLVGALRATRPVPALVVPE